MGCLFAVGAAHIADMQVAPEQIGVRHRDGNEIAAVDGHSGPFLRGGFAFPAFVPLAQPHIPERQSLEGSSLAGVVRADEDHALAEFNVGIAGMMTSGTTNDDSKLTGDIPSGFSP